MIDSLPATPQIALIDRDGAISYADLSARIHSIAIGLQQFGVEPGQRIAASASNGIELILAFLAAQRLGAVWVGINTSLAVPEKVAQLADCGALLFLGDATAITQIEQARPKLANLTRILSLGGTGSDIAQLVGTHAGDRLTIPLPDPLAPALIGYTSGTTGQPKGAVHCQHSVMAFLNACYASDEKGQWVPGLRRTLPIPITVANGMIYGPVAALTGGGSFVATDRVDAAGLGEWIDRHQAEVLNCAPPTLHDLLFRPDLQQLSLKSLKAVAVGGAPPSHDLYIAFKTRFGFDLIADYGLTEAPASVVSTVPHKFPPLRSTGTAHSHLRVAIMDADGNTLPPDTEGELCAGPHKEGRWAGVFIGMLGYWKKPDETAAAFRDGWLRTGDMGMMDARGNVTLVGRKKEMVLRGGANIYPAEIEQALRTHVKVNDAVIVGLPDARLGELVAAYVQVESDVDVTSELASELRSHCLSLIARYKVPERWFVIPEIPRNVLKKPMRNLLDPASCVEIAPLEMSVRSHGSRTG